MCSTTGRRRSASSPAPSAVWAVSTASPPPATTCCCSWSWPSSPSTWAVDRSAVTAAFHTHTPFTQPPLDAALSGFVRGGLRRFPPRPSPFQPALDRIAKMAYVRYNTYLCPTTEMRCAMSNPAGYLKSLKSESVVQQVINCLTDAMVSGQLRPGVDHGRADGGAIPLLWY